MWTWRVKNQDILPLWNFRKYRTRVVPELEQLELKEKVASVKASLDIFHWLCRNQAELEKDEAIDLSVVKTDVKKGRGYTKYSQDSVNHSHHDHDEEHSSVCAYCNQLYKKQGEVLHKKISKSMVILVKYRKLW
jgi:hypothetical protein